MLGVILFQRTNGGGDVAMRSTCLWFWPRRRLKTDQLPPQRFEKRLAEVPEFLFQALGAIAIAARPWLRAILILAAPSIVRILNSRQFKILFPVGPLFEKRCRTVADLYPARCLILAQPCLSHIPQVLAFRYTSRRNN